jgi:hypothetical protein
MTPDDGQNPGVAFDGLDPRDSRLAVLVAAGKTYREAGAELGVSESTVYRAARNPLFRRAVDECRGHAVEAGLGLLCEAFAAAARELARLVREGTPADAIRLGAWDRGTGEPEPPAESGGEPRAAAAVGVPRR